MDLDSGVTHRNDSLRLGGRAVLKHRNKEELIMSVSCDLVFTPGVPPPAKSACSFLRIVTLLAGEAVHPGLLRDV